VISRGYATETAEVAEARRRPPLDMAGHRVSDTEMEEDVVVTPPIEPTPTA
jgi:hypothetical protein